MEKENIFIKIDNYGTILKNVDGAKVAIRNIKEISKVLDNLTGVKEKSIEALLHNLDVLNTLLNTIRRELPTVKKKAEPHTQGEEIIDQAILSLHDELNALKESLQASEILNPKV